MTPVYDEYGVTAYGAQFTRAQMVGGKWVQVSCGDEELVYRTLYLRGLHEQQQSWSEAERARYNGVTRKPMSTSG